MHKQTKACSIPKSVKDAVWERDGHVCIVCGSPDASPCAHYIARSHGGLGIEQNIVTLCADCHREYDQGACRKQYGKIIQAYLHSLYPDLDERKLVYHKYN
jgi:5-methylcytosine-specific restriction endonuclease McrA